MVEIEYFETIVHVPELSPNGASGMIQGYFKYKQSDPAKPAELKLLRELEAPFDFVMRIPSGAETRVPSSNVKRFAHRKPAHKVQAAAKAA